ncbi:MAG: hypothetical protein F6K19_15990 [Cyanothece sp. SIO1E1]|nr:hypothetical protein [Cyanothece sp. SIO1E1]
MINTRRQKSSSAFFLFSVILTLLFWGRTDIAWAQADLSREIIDTARSTKTIFDPAVWQVIGWGAGAGAAGGFLAICIIYINEQTEKRSNESNHIEAAGLNMSTLEIMARIIIGAGAGVVVISFVKPETALSLLTYSFLSGSIGPSVFNSLQEQVKARLSIKEAQQKLEKVEQEAAEKLQAQKTKAEAEKLCTVLQSFKDKFRTYRDTDQAITTQEFDALWQILHKTEMIAKTHYQAIATLLDELQEQSPQRNEELIKKIDNLVDSALENPELVLQAP